MESAQCRKKIFFGPSTKGSPADNYDEASFQILFLLWCLPIHGEFHSATFILLNVLMGEHQKHRGKRCVLFFWVVSLGFGSTLGDNLLKFHVNNNDNTLPVDGYSKVSRSNS